MKPQIRSTHELAKVLGMSRWTVSRALNGHSGLSPETVAKVLDAAREHGFSPSILGRGLRQGRTKLIGISLPDLVDYFLTDKVAQLQRAIEHRGFHPLFQINTGSIESEKAALERFASMHCSGIVMIASQLKKSDPLLQNFSDTGAPVVWIDPFHEKSPTVVASDRSMAMREAVAYLHSFGHRHISIFGIQNTTGFGRQRFSGLEAGLKEFSGSFAKNLSWFQAGDEADDFACGASMAKDWLERARGKSTAIIALNDRVALGAMRVLQLAGLGIPRDVSIIGYDNADFSAHAAPALSTIDPHVSELIDQAVKFLFPVEETSPAESAKPKPALIKPTLVIRASTGKAPSRS